MPRFQSSGLPGVIYVIPSGTRKTIQRFLIPLWLRISALKASLVQPLDSAICCGNLIPSHFQAPTRRSEPQSMGVYDVRATVRVP